MANASWWFLLSLVPLILCVVPAPAAAAADESGPAVLAKLVRTAINVPALSRSIDEMTRKACSQCFAVRFFLLISVAKFISLTLIYYSSIACRRRWIVCGETRLIG